MPTIHFRREAYGEHGGDVPIVLAKITHPDLAAPVYLSSDPTTRFSVDPLEYGTLHEGVRYLYVLMSARWPDDLRDRAQSTQLIFSNVTADMVALIREMTSQATIDLKLVMASTPDIVEQEARGLNVVKASYDAERITLDVSREPIMNEPWPQHRMSRDRLPGLIA